MLERGRDTNGVFYSGLNRVTMAPLVFADALEFTPHDHQNLLRLLYTLTNFPSKPKYRDAADAEVRRFIKNEYAPHLSNRPWMLWERCFAAAPEQRQHSGLATSPSPTDLRRDSGFIIRAGARIISARLMNLAVGIDRLLDIPWGSGQAHHRAIWRG
jgi:hypothetical protein